MNAMSVAATMSLGPLLTDVVVTFCLAAGLLYHYGNCMRHHIVVTVAVLIAWYFSFLIVFVLPLDVSSVSKVVISLVSQGYTLIVL